MDNSTYQNGILQTKRTIQYSPDEIYATFSDPTRLARWWGPNNFTNTFETFEFITGGHWNFLMHGPDGHDYPNKSVFKELLTGEKLVIEHISPPRFTLSVFLSPIENGTQVHWSKNLKIQWLLRRCVI